MSNDARTAILTRVRGALEHARGATHGSERRRTAADREGSWSVPAQQRADRFGERLKSVGGHVWAPDTPEDVGPTLRHVLGSLGPERIAISDSPGLAELVHGFTRGRPSVTVLPASAGRTALLEADVGVTGAQWGIAETGTLVLDASVERHRLVSLLPAVHVALLPVTAILGTLGEALRAIRCDSGAVRGRAVTFVTGPSRTADIELTLVVGVHGPKELHVILTPETVS